MLDQAPRADARTVTKRGGNDIQGSAQTGDIADPPDAFDARDIPSGPRLQLVRLACTVLAAVALLATDATYWVRTHPVNKIWMRGQPFDRR